MRETHNQISLEKRLAETHSAPPRAPIPAIRKSIEKLREVLPPLLKVAQYCEIRNCCVAKAYEDFKAHPELAVKDGGATRVVRDVALDIIGSLRPWLPEKDRIIEKDKPFARSRHRTWPANGTANAVKPTPGTTPVVSRPRRERPKHAKAAQAPAPVAQPEPPTPAAPQSHSAPRRRGRHFEKSRSAAEAS
jgi:hypothetical protein